MSVQPIDLQVLFSRLNQISRDQAVQKDMLVQSQAVTADEIVEKSDEKGHAVTSPDTAEEGPESLGDKQDGSQQQEGERRQEKEKDPQSSEFLRDPDLGQNIDISG